MREVVGDRVDVGRERLVEETGRDTDTFEVNTDDHEFPGPTSES